VREFHRVLKPGGRISIAEPILRDDQSMRLKKICRQRPPSIPKPVHASFASLESRAVSRHPRENVQEPDHQLL
jgi:predicted SAM-dependent methyltransferase